MIAFKAFEKGLICRGYQFKMGLNVTEKANCRANGFHCAENPLDCLSYYPNMDTSEYYMVDALGDIDEDGLDSKISCTELNIIKKLSKEEFFFHGLVYMYGYPLIKWADCVQKDRAAANNGYAVVRGTDPEAKGNIGDILAFVKEDPVKREITEISLQIIDGEKILPGVWYGADLIERKQVD